MTAVKRIHLEPWDWLVMDSRQRAGEEALGWGAWARSLPAHLLSPRRHIFSSHAGPQEPGARCHPTMETGTGPPR